MLAAVLVLFAAGLFSVVLGVFIGMAIALGNRAPRPSEWETDL